MDFSDISTEELIQMEQEHFQDILSDAQPPFSPEMDAEFIEYLENLEQPTLDGTEELMADENLDDFYDHDEEDWSLWVAPPSPIYSDTSIHQGTSTSQCDENEVKKTQRYFQHQ